MKYQGACDNPKGIFKTPWTSHLLWIFENIGNSIITVSHDLQDIDNLNIKAKQRFRMCEHNHTTRMVKDLGYDVDVNKLVPIE